MFDFLADDIDEPLVPEVVHHGPNEKSLRKKGRKDVIQDIIDIYFEPGMGKDMMRTHMKTDPKAYFDVVKKLIPAQLPADIADRLHITVTDRFGTGVEISAGGNGGNGDNLRAHDRDLTHGSSPASGRADPPRITVKDRFEVGSPKNETVTGNSVPRLPYDFSL